MIEQTAQEIIKKVNHLQNGDISNAMERMGIYYGTNYGVSIPQLQQLAKKYECNSALAFYLFDKPIREAKILSSMLFDLKNIKSIQLVTLSERINNLELIEQFSRNIYSKLPDLKTILSKLAKGTIWQKALAIYAISWSIKKQQTIQADLINWGVIQVQMLKGDEDNLLQKAYVFLLQNIASINYEYKLQMIKLAKDIGKSEKASSKSIAKEFLFIH